MHATEKNEESNRCRKINKIVWTGLSRWAPIFAVPCIDFGKLLSTPHQTFSPAHQNTSQKCFP